MIYRKLIIITVLFGTASPGIAEEAVKRRPNILFIAADDLNTRLGSYGDPLVKSPNIDKFAAGAIRFDRAYCQYPLCNPSRTSMLSGKRPDTTKVIDNRARPKSTLGKDAVFLPEFFHANGYFTARVGKIAHHAYEDDISWDLSEHPRGPKDENLMTRAYQAIDGKGIGEFSLGWKATDTKDEEEPDGVTATRIIQLLEKAGKDKKPFFIAAGFYRPHLPFVAPKRHFEHYPVEKVKLPEEPADHVKSIPKLALNYNPNDAKLTEIQRREAIAGYLASVSFTDSQVGRVLDALDRLKLADDTIVVFFGDHGFHLGEHGGLYRKMSLFEESARVPLVIRVPGKKPGVSNRLAELVDLYPTLADLAGLKVPADLEGTSLVPVLNDVKREWKKAAFTIVTRRSGPDADPVFGRTIRTEKYRFTQWDDGTQQLYDHDSDPREFVNLAIDPTQKVLVNELKQALAAGWKSALPK